MQNHMALMLRLDDKDWFVDVGLGESPLSPLEYHEECTQTSAEGMKSRFICVGDHVVLESFDHKAGIWKPRLKWLASETRNTYTLNDFESDLHDTFGQGSMFRRKLVASRLTRDEKLVLAGDKLKRTTQRYSEDEALTIENLKGKHQVRQALHREFGVPLEETIGVSGESK